MGAQRPAALSPSLKILRGIRVGHSFLLFLRVRLLLHCLHLLFFPFRVCLFHSSYAALTKTVASIVTPHVGTGTSRRLPGSFISLLMGYHILWAAAVPCILPSATICTAWIIGSLPPCTSSLPHLSFELGLQQCGQLHGTLQVGGLASL